MYWRGFGRSNRPARLAIGPREHCRLARQPAHRALRRGERARLDTEALEHGDVEIGQWVVVRFVKGEVLAVFEAAAREEHGEVVVVVVVAVAGVAAVEHLRAVEQVCFAFLRGLQAFEKGGELLKLRDARLGGSWTRQRPGSGSALVHPRG